MESKADVTQKLMPRKSTPKVDEGSAWRATAEVIMGAIPSTFGLLFVFIAETINIIFIGRYNEPKLISAIGIGTLYINNTGYVLGAGLIGGLDTLCSQTFGAKQYKLMGIYANIARFIVLIFFVLICLPSVYYASTVLNLLGQFKEVSEIAAVFSYSMVPSLFFSLQYNTSLRYLQAMKIFSPGMFITMATALLHPFWCYIFIFYFNYGVVGAGVAMGITQFLNWVIVTIYIHVKNPCPESYFYFDKDVMQWSLVLDYLKIGVPAAVLFAADWLGFEILTLMASYLSPLDLAANVCLLNFITLIFMITMGLSFAATTLVGNSIGEQNAERAKLYAKGALGCGLSMISVTTILVILFRHSIPYIYTSEPEIANLVSGLLGIYIFFSLIDCTQVILHGVIKGLGLQKMASAVCLVVLYPVNIPLAYCFAFVWGFGLNGLWYSQLCSVFLLAISYSLIVCLVDWKEIAHQAVAHFDKEQKGINKRKSQDVITV